MTAIGNLDPRREWSAEEITDLELCASIGDSAAQIAEYLERTETEVRTKAAELGIKIERLREGQIARQLASSFELLGRG